MQFWIHFLYRNSCVLLVIHYILFCLLNYFEHMQSNIFWDCTGEIKNKHLCTGQFLWVNTSVFRPSNCWCFSRTCLRLQNRRLRQERWSKDQSRKCGLSSQGTLHICIHFDGTLLHHLFLPVLHLPERQRASPDGFSNSFRNWADRLRQFRTGERSYLPSEFWIRIWQWNEYYWLISWRRRFRERC